MISKAKIKYIHQLEQKKSRRQEGVFVAEGPKVVSDLLNTTPAQLVIATQQWLDNNHLAPDTEYIVATEEELRKVSFLQHPQQVVAVFKQMTTPQNLPSAENELVLALDGVQDPGNMGTIVRIADWFGIGNIVCSQDTADIYNPKVVQATMGSIARVNVTYTDLVAYLYKQTADTPIYGTLLDGNNIYKEVLSANGIIVMGNEGKGISEQIRTKVNRRLLIPNYPLGRPTADSLNVAIATAITCSEFRRKE